MLNPNRTPELIKKLSDELEADLTCWGRFKHFFKKRRYPCIECKRRYVLPRYADDIFDRYYLPDTKLCDRCEGTKDYQRKIQYEQRQANLKRQQELAALASANILTSGYRETLTDKDIAKRSMAVAAEIMKLDR